MKACARVSTVSTLLLIGTTLCGTVKAAELAQVCWLTEAQTLLRFSVTQSGTNHYTYTGIFNDADGEDSANYALTGAIEVAPDGKLVGSFSGSKSSTASFKTFIATAAIDPVTFAGTVELIRNKYDRQTLTTRTDYRTHSLTKTSCP